MSAAAGTQAGTTTVRVSLDTYAELVRAQQEIAAEHGWKVSLSDIIKQALADRKPVQP